MGKTCPRADMDKARPWEMGAHRAVMPDVGLDGTVGLRAKEKLGRLIGFSFGGAAASPQNWPLVGGWS